MVDFSDDLGDDSVVGLDFLDEDGGGVLETNNLLRRNAEESLLVLKLDVRAFDPKLVAELDGPAASLLLLGEEGNIERLFLVIFDDELNRVENCHSPGRMDVEILPDLILQHSKIDIILISSSGDSNSITEVIDGLSRIPSPPHSIDRQNSRIVPTIDPIGEDHLMQFPL